MTKPRIISHFFGPDDVSQMIEYSAYQALLEQANAMAEAHLYIVDQAITAEECCLAAIEAYKSWQAFKAKWSVAE